MFLYSTVSTLNPEAGISFRNRCLHFPASGLRKAHHRVAGGEEVGLTNCRDGGDDFTELELVQDGGLTSGVKTDHQDAHLLAAP